MKIKQISKKQEIQKSTQKGSLIIVCTLDSAGYDVLSGSDCINRVAALQSRIQSVIDSFEPAGKNKIEVERIEISYLSMTHVWRNA